MEIKQRKTRKVFTTNKVVNKKRSSILEIAKKNHKKQLQIDIKNYLIKKKANKDNIKIKSIQKYVKRK